MNTEITTEARPFNLIRALCDTRDCQLQKARIQFSNRLAAIERGADNADDGQRQLCQKYLDYFNTIEREINKDIRKSVKDEPVFERLSGIKGIGPILAAKMIAMIDIEKCETVSALWRFCGYGVIDGQRERPTKGEKLHYNTRLKTACYLVATSFIKLGDKSPYRALYDQARERYATKAHSCDCPPCHAKVGDPWKPGHQHAAAIRWMIKQFLADLWVEWRELKGLPVRDPYCHEKMGNTTLRNRKEFGW